MMGIGENMRTFILTKIHSCSANTEPKDLEKGLTHIVVLEATKRIGDVVVPDFVKAKSMLKLDTSDVEQLFEVEIFNIGDKSGGPVKSYYRILRKGELAKSEVKK